MNEFEFPKTILLNSKTDHSSGNQIDYGALFYKYFLSKWYIYLAFVSISLVLAYFYSKSIQSVYQVSSKLMIRLRDENYGPAEDIVKNNVNFSTASENASNEIEILTSFALMKSVVDELELDKRYFWKDKFAELDAFQNFPISVDSFLLRTPQKVSFRIDPINKYSFKISKDALTETHQFGELFSNQYGTFRINQTGVKAKASNRSMHVEFSDAREVTQKLLDVFKVELSDVKNKSSVLLLTINDAIPQRGIDLLTKLLDKFNKIKSDANAEVSLKTIDMIEGRLADIGAELSSAENSVESFKVDNDIISETTSDLNVTLEDVNNLIREQRNIELQMKMLQVMASDFRDTTNKFKLIPFNPALYDGKIQDLIQPYNDAVAERERLLMRGVASNPVVLANQQKLKSLRSSINTALEHMQDDLSLQLNKLQNQYDKSSARLKTVPIKERGLTDKLRNKSIKEGLYVYLLRKREETAMALVGNYTNAILVDPPHSTVKPISPNKMIIFPGAALGGISLPFLLMVLLDLFRNSIQTEKDIKQIVPEKTIMGVINYRHNQKNKLSQQLTTERFRSLRMNLHFQSQKKNRIILITSSTTGEGKTFIATNLAISFAQAKKSTIVVDFDLRRPSVGKYFKGNSEIGLSSFFIGASEVQELVQVSDSLPNLHFILGGPLIPNVLELITEEHLSDLFGYLKAKYEVIIIDSSPIGMISDSILLNSYVDNTLFVVRSSYTKKSMVEKAKEFFKQNKMVNPSIVFNGLKKQNDVYGYSHKHYDYS